MHDVISDLVKKAEGFLQYTQYTNGARYDEIYNEYYQTFMISMAT